MLFVSLHLSVVQSLFQTATEREEARELQETEPKGEILLTTISLRCSKE